MRRILCLSAALAGVTALAACGGGGGSGGTGGGGGVIPPGPGGPYVQATPAPGLQPLPSGYCVAPAQNAAALTVNSNPQNAWVEITNAAGTTTYVLGQTPQTCHLNPTFTGIKVTVLGSVGQTPQTTTVAGNQNATVYFNAIADSSGSAQAGSGTLSTMRSPAGAHANLAGVVRRAVRRGARVNDVIPGAFSVVYRPGALSMEGRTPNDVERSLGLQGRAIGNFNGLTWRAIRVAPAQAAAVQAQLQARPDVAAVYPAHYRRLQAIASVQSALRPQDATTLPNDTFMDPYDQWDMFRISMGPAWGITQGSTSVPIAVIDTGYDVNNADLASKVTRAQVYYTGKGTIVATPQYEDTDGHGTNVSGIAAAVTNNGEGFAGVGWQTSLLEYKIFADEDHNSIPCVYENVPTLPQPDPYDCSASSTDEAAAIADAEAHGAKVINLSLGSLGSPDVTEYTAIESAIAQGIVVVAAAGNDASSNGIEYPGGYRGVISVGASAIHGDSCTNGVTSATNPCDTSSGVESLASYSDYGPTADAPTNPTMVNQPTLVAPGGDPNGNADSDGLHWIFNLYSKGVTAPGLQCNPSSTGGVCASYFAGTSQATPHVAGAVALIRTIAPSLTPAQILALFQNTSNEDNLNVPGQGAGRLSVLKVLQAAGGTASQSNGTPPSLGSFVAIAYRPGANGTPQIFDQQYPNGVPVNADGSFRLSDIQAGVTYEVGIWLDVNHDGVVDQGDWFGVAGGAGSPNLYSAAGSYNYGTITVQQVGSGFVLR